nr:hypothetical protein [Tanacetum cinerariifolium]
LYNYDPNAYSFDNSNYFPQSQDENYLCNLCGNNSHDGYDCQQQFPFVYEQEPSYNQNYDDNYYPHESSSYPCCDYCGESHETFQCQPDNQNIEFSGSDQIQTLQYPDVNPPSLEIKKPQILFQTWETFFAIQCSQPEDSNELFQKLLKDLKELTEYDQSTSTDRPIFLNDNEDHPRESPKNSSEENVVSKTNQEPPQDSDIHQLIEECSVEVPEQQKHNMEKTMLDLVKICHHKQFLFMHDNVDDLIESALDSKLLSINSINSQRLDKKEKEVKIVEEQPAELPDPVIVSIEEENVVQREEEEVDLEDISQVQDVVIREKLFSITCLISNIESLNKNSTPDRNDIPDNSSNDLLLEEVDLFLSDNSIPSGIENVVDDPEGDIRFLEELLINDSILSHESSDSNFEDNPSISRPPPEPPDDNFDLEPEVISAVMEDIDEPDEHFNLGGEIFVSTNNEDVDYFPFMFVIRIFLPYLILLEISPLLLSAESEDTIFDPGISKLIQ